MQEQSGRTRLLDKSSLTIIAAGQSRFYKDNTSLLSKEGSRSTVWSCFEKHMFVTQAAEDAHVSYRSNTYALINCRLR